MLDSMARHPKLAFSLSVLVLAVSLNACSSGPATGQLTRVDGGTQIVVPALWADADSQEGGIEPATIWVDSSRTSDTKAYEVNLTDVKAKGGGAQWQAATSTAAVLGTLFSGIDPDDVACKFEITGPIDGPSAGAILTVGVLAALKQQPLNSQTTMTGTISPDGSIGPVGLVGSKLRAASQAGYKTVILPALQNTVTDPESGETVDTVTFAKELGIKVRFVRSIVEAYEAFSDAPATTNAPEQHYAFADFPKLNAARTQAAAELQADIETRLAEYPDAPELVTNQLANSQAALKENDPSAAFALAVDSLDELERWRGRVNFNATIGERGVVEARTQLLDEVLAQSAIMSAQIDATTTNPAFRDPAQMLALPGTLAWLTYGRAILSSIEQSISGTSLDAQPVVLANYAALAYQIIGEAEAVFPRTLDVLGAVPASHVSVVPDDDVFLSGYTNFLVEAANANLTYLQEVLDITAEESAKSAVTSLIPVAYQLEAQAKSIDAASGSIDAELEESSIAMTYYVTTMSLISSLQVLGGPDLWLDRNEASVGDLSYITQSVNVSDMLVSTTADELLSAGLNAGLPLWSADWGTAAYIELAKQDRTAVGSSIALNELWFDAITVLSMQAYVTPDSRQ